MATVYVREDGTGDYTTLAAAVTANETEIEIHGVWDSAENATIYIDEASTVIETIGAAKHPGHRGASPTHHRLERGGHCLLVQGTGIEVIGLDVNLLSPASFNVALGAVDFSQTANITAEFKDCIVSSESLATTLYGFYAEAQDGYDTTVDFVNCIASDFPSGHGFYGISSTAGSDLVVNINFCTSFGNGSGIYAVVSAGSIAVNAFTTIFVGNSTDFGSFGGATWDIHYCIDSDGSIDSRDTGAVGCLTDMNETDDDTKSSDGDWIIFRDITTAPYDLRLAYNDYNDAVEMHSESSGAGMSWPAYDVVGKRREYALSCGAYQMPWIVEEDGNYDYTTVAAALSGGRQNIEIWGSWDSGEDSDISVGEQSTHIEAIGAARHPGYVGSSPTHHRFRSIGTTLAAFDVQWGYVILTGLDIKSNSRADFAYTLQNGSALRNTSDCHFRDLIIWSDETTYDHMGLHITTQVGNGETYVENCFIYGFQSSGLRVWSQVISAGFQYAYINSCTILGCNQSDSIYAGGIRASEIDGEVHMELFNTICVNNGDNGTGNGDFSESDTPSWDLQYCIDSDGSIDDVDAGAVGCLTDHNPTDDCSKSSDGDWVIFEDLTTNIDLRLCDNDYNEAIDWHSVSLGAMSVYRKMVMPGRDISGQPRSAPFSAGSAVAAPPAAPPDIVDFYKTAKIEALITPEGIDVAVFMIRDE